MAVSKAVPHAHNYFGNPKTQLTGQKARQLRLQKMAAPKKGK